MEGTNPLLQDHFHKILIKLCESMTVGLIKTGLRKCGIFPLDQNPIGVSRLFDFPTFSKLKTTFCEFWTSIKIKISMTKESEIKTKIIYTRAMATAKNCFWVITRKLLFRYVCRGKKGIFLGEVKWKNFQLVGGVSPISPVVKTLVHSVSLNLSVLPGAVPASPMESFIFLIST